MPTSGHAGIKPGVYTECAQNPVISEVVQKAKRTGTSRSGAVYEQLMRVREPDSGETLLLRRITVKLKVATRDGDTELHILSNVPSGRATAAQLARAYGKRWSIETAFFEITTTFTREINTLGYPKAALFAFCLALLAYNAVSLIKAGYVCIKERKPSQDEAANLAYLNKTLKSAF